MWLTQYFEDSALAVDQLGVYNFIIDKIGNSEYLMEALE